MPDPLVVQVMNGFRRDLLQKEAQQRTRMARQWMGVERALQEQVESFAERVARDGLTPGQIRSRQFQMDRYASLLAQTRLELDKYVDVVQPDIEAQQRRLGQLGAQSAIAAINAVTGGVRAGFDVLPVGAIENMVGLAGNGSPLHTLLRASYGAGAHGMLEQLIHGVALGVNPRNIARNMVRLGLSQTLNRVMVTARTEPLRVYREASRQQYQASGVVTHFRRLATRDRRTCPACLFADGEVHELGDNLREHPQGRCTTVPVVQGFKPVEWEKGIDWFRKQPPKVQAKMLGRGRFDAWQSGQIELEQVVSVRANDTWGDSLQPTPLRDIFSAKPFVVRGLPDRPAPKPKPAAPTVNTQTATQARKRITALEKDNTKQVAAIQKQVDKLNTEIDISFEQINNLRDPVDYRINPRLAELNRELIANDYNVPQGVHDEMAALRTERFRLMEQVDRIQKQVREGPLARKEELGRQLKTLNEQLKADILKVVQVDDPSNVGLRYSKSIDRSIAEHFDNAATEFNKLVSRDIVLDVSQIDLKRLRAGGRAFAYSSKAEIHVTSDEDTRVIIHEMAHILEVRGGLLDKVNAFYDQRTQGEPLEWLGKLTGNKYYGKEERARKDKFIDPYMGKDYSQKGTGRGSNTTRPSTEIVSMGLEYIYAEPARLAKEDPDYFDFIYDLVRGK